MPIFLLGSWHEEDLWKELHSFLGTLFRILKDVHLNLLA